MRTIPTWVELVISLNATFVLGILLLNLGIDLFAVGYVVIMVPPLIALGLDRLSRPGDMSALRMGLDVLAFTASAARAFTDVLPFSGHVLMLLYALGTARRPTVYSMAGIALTGAMAIKLAWADVLTPIGGVIIGAGMAVIWRAVQPRTELPTEIREDVPADEGNNPTEEESESFPAGEESGQDNGNKEPEEAGLETIKKAN